MSVLEKQTFVSEEDYLRLEEFSEEKHEFVEGIIYSMSGAKNRHNEIAMNCYGNLFAKLKGGPCKPFNSDTKVKIQQDTRTRYYYPDCMVICDRNKDSEAFQENPALIIEVLSDSTRRTDISEKKEAYLSIPSLENFILIEQDQAKVVVFRRDGSDFVHTIIEGLDADILLPKLDLTLSLSEIYEDITFDT